MMPNISPGSIVCSFLVMDAIEHGAGYISYQAYDTVSDMPVTLVQLVGEENETALLQRAQNQAAASIEPVRVVAENGIVALIYGLPPVEEPIELQLSKEQSTLEPLFPPAPPPPSEQGHCSRQVVSLSKKYYGFIGAGIMLLFGYLLWSTETKSQGKLPSVTPTLENPRIQGKGEEHKTEEAQEAARSQGEPSPSMTREELYERLDTLIQRESLHESVRLIEQEMQEYVSDALDRLLRLLDESEAWEDAEQDEANNSVLIFKDGSERIRKMYMEACDKVLHEVQGSESELSSDEWSRLLADYCHELESERDENIQSAVDQYSDRFKEGISQQREEVQRRQHESMDEAQDNEIEDGDLDEVDDDNEMTAEILTAAEEELSAQTDKILKTLEETREQVLNSLENETDSKPAVWDTKMAQSQSRWRSAIKKAKKNLDEMGDLLDRPAYDNALSTGKKEDLLREYNKLGSERIKELTNEVTQAVRNLENEHREHIREERRSHSEGRTNYPFRRAEFRRL